MFDRHAKLALILVCLTMTVGAVGLRAAVRGLDVYLRKLPVRPREHLSNISTVLPGWRLIGGERKYSAEMVEELGTDIYLERVYVREDDPDEAQIQLHVTYYTGMIDAVPHVPDRCFIAAGYNTRSTPRNMPVDLARAGWRDDPAVTDPGGTPWPMVTYPHPITHEVVSVHMPAGEFRLRTTEFSHDDALDRRVYAGYLFIANGRIAVTPEEVKLLAFKKSERYAYYCKVQLHSIGGRDLTPEQFVTRSAEFLDALLPELMRCLPDWPEVQARAAAGTG
ncbi:MAG: hypothetical protein GY715_19015 [Planctomycetes bacterium]|nr:hypothetical protein [Planctomycetota bacterium]